ncbi:MAG: PHP-associated domain-containing protein [Thermodesulfobacteriota bacterium]
MLQYLRNKLISVDRINPLELQVHGILDDDLYGLEMEAVFGLEELDIRSISGKWHRWTTPECPRAVPPLQAAVGIRVEPGFRNRVQKVVGRGACRHFANLLLEMGHAASSAARIIQNRLPEVRSGVPAAAPESTDGEQASRSRATAATVAPGNDPAPEPLPPGDARRPAARNAPERNRPEAKRLVIDLHAHTSPASPCSSITVENLIAEARQAGLDGIVLTDHNHCRKPRELEELRQKHGFLVLGGNEIITDQGDVLTYGLDHTVSGVIRLPELRAKVRAVGGFMAVAHPFRGFLIFSGQQLGMTIEKAAERNLFQWVDAIEILNGKVTEQENDFSRQVAERIGLPGIAGSDAHESGTIGTYATEFFTSIQNEADLVAALHAGEYRTIRFRR